MKVEHTTICGPCARNAASPSKLRSSLAARLMLLSKTAFEISILRKVGGSVGSRALRRGACSSGYLGLSNNPPCLS